jgi:DNA-binding MarR family transcriptional regulator
MQTRCGHPKGISVEDFRGHLRVLEREVVRQLEGETTCCGVTLAQCHALLELSSSELSLTSLAAALDLDTSTLSRTVEGMVKAGLVERAVDAADRRSVRLTLTPTGRERIATINEMCNRHYAALLGELSATDQRRVVRAVRLLADSMRRLRAGQQSQGSCCGTAKRRADRGGSK